MKNMALLIDTNIVLDWLLERQPLSEWETERYKNLLDELGCNHFSCSRDAARFRFHDGRERKCEAYIKSVERIYEVAERVRGIEVLHDIKIAANGMPCLRH